MDSELQQQLNRMAEHILDCKRMLQAMQFESRQRHQLTTTLLEEVRAQNRHCEEQKQILREMLAATEDDSADWWKRQADDGDDWPSK